MHTPQPAAALMVLLAASLAMSSHARAVDAPDATSQPPPDKSGYTLFNPTPEALLRGFNTDRPAKGSSPITVDAGRWQVESDLVFYSHANVAGTSTRLTTAFDPVLKLGLTNRVDLEVQFGGYNWLHVSDPGQTGAAPSTSGVGDLYVRAKINLFGNEGGAAAAIIPYVKAPTAAETIGNGHTEGGVVLPISLPLPLDLTLTVVPELDVFKNMNDSGHHLNVTNIVNLSYPLTKTVTAFVELYNATGADRHIPPATSLDLALTWLVTETLQLDLGTNVGLNRQTPNLQLYTGISKRF